ncbi:MAG: methenyltetrahydrofolate cyclohydrolase [Methylomonas sp.]|jgi:formiminotetrahydrofolate cyclodeaminase
MTEMIDYPVRFFLDELASKQATPGGGSTAALQGAQAAALIGMVCNLTIGKPKYAAVEAEMRALLAESERLRAVLTGMIKTDIDVFNALMACYALPKNSDAEKSHRSAQIQAVLVDAVQAPFDCAVACGHVLKLSRIAAEKGNTGVVSDAGVAVMAAYCGLKSAALNVRVNAKGLKNRDFADAKLSELQHIVHEAEIEVVEIYRLVDSRL